MCTIRIGRALSSVSVGAGNTLHASSYAHDTLGRVMSSTQTVAGVPANPFQYTMSLADQLMMIQYPTGRQLGVGLDGAGRLSYLKDNVSGLQYVSGVGYNADGSVSAMTMGNSVTESYGYNDRLQLTSIGLAKSGVGSLLNLAFYPCAASATLCASGNTGNVQAEAITVPVPGGSPITRTRSFGYDVLNRVTSFGDGMPKTNQSNQNYVDGPVQSYGYAGNHNWLVTANDGTGFPLSAFTPGTGSITTPTPTGPGVNTANYDVSEGRLVLAGTPMRTTARTG